MSEEEMKALVEMKDMLKHENEKLKQDKQGLIKELKLFLEFAMYENYEYTVSERKLETILEKLGE